MEDAKHYWQQRYEQNQTGWDLGEVSPPLKAYIDQLTDKNISILIPGAGNAYEAHYLMQQGFTNITVIDIAPAPIDRLKSMAAAAVNQGHLKLVCGDFFEHTRQYDLVLEQTFFCAIDPGLRESYAAHMSSIIRPGGKLAGVMFNREFEGGPPFGGNTVEYIKYFEPYFSHVSFEACYNSAQPRQGSEVFVKLIR